MGKFKIFCSGPMGQGKYMDTSMFVICILLFEHMENHVPAVKGT